MLSHSKNFVIFLYNFLQVFLHLFEEAQIRGPQQPLNKSHSPKRSCNDFQSEQI